MMIIDCHVHYDDGEIKEFVEEARRNKMKICLIGRDAFFPHPSWKTNNEVGEALKKYPDDIYGFAHVALGHRKKTDDIKRYYERGFKGLKFIFPADFYDSEEYFPVYALAEKLKMVCLFHTGIVSPMPDDNEMKIASKYMHPLTIDTIARAFPDLKIIIAHLGIPFYEVGAHLIRIHANVYADLSGAGIWGYIGQERLKSLLDWRNIFFPGSRTYYHKLVYGSDAYVSMPFMLKKAKEGYERLFDELELSRGLKEKIFFSTMRDLLK